MFCRPGEKIKSIEEIKGIVSRMHLNGARIVFVNGCFDLLHAGHVRYLQHARAFGDALILGVNSDACVQKLKGQGRPLQSEKDRAEILASMGCVDYVVVFNEPTVDALLMELKPDIHAKGTDYTEDSVPERATVLAYGGQTAIVGDAKNHSTRDLIQTILNKFNP
jgi:D-glycero-beta-D-manno-heptose 1-phosphate adenylyltransferase